MNEQGVTSKRSIPYILFAIILISAIVRIYGLDNQSLSYDEVVEESAFIQFFSQFFLDINPNNSPIVLPPLNAFFIYLMTIISPGSDFGLRIPAFLFGMVSIPLLFILGRQLFNEKVGLIASFLLAISPFHIWYSQDARMYALNWMLTLISLIYFLRAIEQPTFRNYSGFVIASVAALYTHQLSIMLLALQGVFLFLYIKKYKSQFPRWISAFVTILILYLPWIFYTITTVVGRNAGFLSEIKISYIFYTIYAFSVGFSIGPSLREMHLDQTMNVTIPYITSISLIIIVYAPSFLMGLFSSKKNKSGLVFILVLLTVPILGIIVLNKIMPNISFNVRYVGIALFGFLIAVAKGIDWMSIQKPKKPAIIISALAMLLVTGISAYSYANYQFNKKYQKPDLRGAAAYIDKQRDNHDAILCLINSGVINRYATKYQCTPFYIDVADTKENTASIMQKTVDGKKRLWLILNQEWYTENIRNVEEWLDANYNEITNLQKGISEIANVRIYAYDLTKTKTLNSRR